MFFFTEIVIRRTNSYQIRYQIRYLQFEFVTIDTLLARFQRCMLLLAAILVFFENAVNQSLQSYQPIFFISNTGRRTPFST